MACLSFLFFLENEGQTAKNNLDLLDVLNRTIRLLVVSVLGHWGEVWGWLVLQSGTRSAPTLAKIGNVSLQLPSSDLFLF